jgi:rhamnogalacturonyl hydrolase YesR
MQRCAVALVLCLSFAVSIHAQTESLWTTSTVPANTTGNDSSSVELGLRFSSNVAGSVTGARIYCASNSSGTHTVHLWNSTGTSLGTATLPACSGWTAVNFASSIAVTAGSTYTISYHTTEYPWNTEFFTAAVTNGNNLTAPANAGVYGYGSSPAYPSSTWEATNYWVDVLFTPATATPTYTISGTISGIGSATVALSGAASASSVASSAGTYSFTGLANSSYTVTPSLTGYTFSPTSRSVTVSSANVTVPVFTATAVVTTPTFTISGTISPSPAGSGTTVTLSGAASATTTANSSGNYTFTGLANGSYTVTPSESGYTFTPGSQTVTLNGADLPGINFTAQAATPGSISIDTTTSRDGFAASSTISSLAFSTVSGNELLLAFVSTDYLSGANTTVTTVSGGGLTWVLVVRTNVQSGGAEIWRAFATVPLSNVSVTATLSQSGVSSMTVMSFAGVDTTGTNGSDAIGTTGTGNAKPGAPSASLTTTRNNSWVFGVGNDYDNAVSRTLGPDQTLVHQDLAPTGDTYWVQRQTSSTPVSGTVVTINDTAPTSDRYNLSICEILPALTSGTQTWSISGTISPSSVGRGATVTLSGAASVTTTANASGNYSFTGLANGNYTVTPTLAGDTFTPTSQMVTVTNANGTANFTASLAAPSITSLSPASGAAGTPVTIAGTNFGTPQGSSTVSFNGTAAAVTSWTASSIVALVPVGATSGYVVVTVGGVASNGSNFTVLPLQTSLPTNAQVLAAIEKVNYYWITNNPTPGNSDWTQATYFTGDLAAYDATGQSNYLSFAQSWASQNNYSLDSGNTTNYANYQAAGQVYIRLYQLNPVASYIAGITESINGMVTSLNSSGVDDEWTWIDAINMSMPDFAELGSIDNNTNYYAAMYSFYSYAKYTLGLFDPTTGLWWENSTYANTSTYWSRGNGWVFAAHAKVLSVLPTSDPHYAEYLSTFIGMAQALAARQQPGGYWNADLGGTDYAGPESSGTSFFLYGFAWGLNNGVLPTTYLPVVENAWNFFANTAIQSSGLLGYVQPTGSAPGPTTATTTEDFGVGAFLLAARQMALLTN